MEKLGNIAGHWGWGGLSGGLGFTSGVLGNVKDFNNIKGFHGGNLDIASGSIGMAGAGLDTLSNMGSFAGNMAGLARSRKIAGRGTKAGTLLGNKMTGKSVMGGVQSGLGMLSGLAGIGSSASTLAGGIHTRAGNESGSETAGKVGSGFGLVGGALQTANEGIGFGSGLKSLIGRSKRTSKAGDFTGDAEVGDIAKFTRKNQNLSGTLMGMGKSTAGLVSGVSNVIGGIAGLAGGDEVKKWAGLTSTIAGGIGSLFGMGQGINNDVGKKATNTDAEAHANSLFTKLQSGNNDSAVRFANQVLGLSGTAQELKDMADQDPAAMKELIQNKLAKYG